jgi:hypothetical protein
MQSIDPDDGVYSLAFCTLTALSRRVRKLPTACFITNPVNLDSQRPLHQTNYSDVYSGKVLSTPVALKALRLHGDDRDTVMKVWVYDYVLEESRCNFFAGF